MERKKLRKSESFKNLKKSNSKKIFTYRQNKIYMKNDLIKQNDI